MDERGFPDQSDDFDHLLHTTSGGTILRKRKHPAPPIDDIDPAFDVTYDEAIHGKQFREEFKPSPLLTPEQNKELADLIKKYWCVFDTKGLFVPVKDYECDIDTGTAAPIVVRGINYGPHETPILRRCIAKLEQMGHIYQTEKGAWLFKALLAPKPHQENVWNIHDFVWRFCVNYIRLNAISKVIAYPIPRCDSYVNIGFGDAKLFWLMDAPQGYHQIRVSEASQEKLAFQGPDAIKWTWRVMPFGWINGPTIFIRFAHDIDSTWKSVAESEGVVINDSTNTRIIVDDIFAHTIRWAIAKILLESQLRVSRSQNFSLNLRKCHFFPERLEFVGIDVTPDGNRPAQSKHELLKTWPTPMIVKDVASFIGFAIFYSKFIPMFEVRISRLRELTKQEYTTTLGDQWDTSAQSAFEDIRNALLQDPVLKRFDHRKRLYLMTDFCKDGFGYCACQPGDDAPSIAAMKREMAGGDCEFLLPNSKLTLHPVAFGCRRTRGNEVRFHFHLGEAFSGDWAINKVRHLIFGMIFTWITDCYALRFILSYDGNNPALLQLQSRLLCWAMVIVHRPGSELGPADFLSRLAADLCFDPFLRDYIQRVQACRTAAPPVNTLPIRPENMPGYRAKRKSAGDASPALDTAAVNLLSAIYVDNATEWSNSLAHVPVQFGQFESSVDLDKVYMASPMYNSSLVLAA